MSWFGRSRPASLSRSLPAGQLESELVFARFEDMLDVSKRHPRSPILATISL
jgi:hypothetical protein